MDYIFTFQCFERELRRWTMENVMLDIHSTAALAVRTVLYIQQSEMSSCLKQGLLAGHCVLFGITKCQVCLSVPVSYTST